MEIDEQGESVVDSAEVEDETVPSDIELKNHIFDLDFHPSLDLLAIAQITGRVKIYRYSLEENVQLFNLKLSSEAVRCVQFSPEYLFAGSSEGALQAVSPESGNIVFAQNEAHDAPLNALALCSPTLVVSGDDDGVVKLWDLRARSCVMQWAENSDFISDFAINREGDTILASGGDGHLSVFNIRKPLIEARSDNVGDELLSLKIIKNGKKVVVGTQEGPLNVWDWDDWGTFGDRFVGHPHSVDTMVFIDENTICTGSSDGLIRLVQIHPNELLGVIGEHEDFPVEQIKLSGNRMYLGSCSHDLSVKFWNMKEIFEDDEEGDGEDAMETSEGRKESEEVPRGWGKEEEEETPKSSKRKPKGGNFFSDLL